LARNPNGLAFSFIEECHFTPKTDQNSIFLGCKAQIPDRLHKMVMYICFYDVLKKNQILPQNSKGLAFGFIEKCKFFTGLKNHISAQNPKGLRFY
jgi:hypothetical protein